MKYGRIIFGLSVVTLTAVATFIATTPAVHRVVDNLEGKVQTLCGIEQPSDDDLRSATLRVLYSRGISACSDTDLMPEMVTYCHRRISELRPWVETQTAGPLQDMYAQWLDWYTNKLDTLYGPEGASERDKEERAEAAQKRQYDDEETRVSHLAECLPKPPAKAIGQQ